METVLKQLFDFQRFEGAAELQRLIDSTHARYSRRQLSLDEAEQISAAGSPEYYTASREAEKDQE